MDPVTVITTAVTDLGADLGGVAAVGLGVGVTLFVLRRGWGLLKSFAR